MTNGCYFVGTGAVKGKSSDGGWFFESLILLFLLSCILSAVIIETMKHHIFSKLVPSLLGNLNLKLKKEVLRSINESSS